MALPTMDLPTYELVVPSTKKKIKRRKNPVNGTRDE
jgi:hypothetical protein